MSNGLWKMADGLRTLSYALGMCNIVLGKFQMVWKYSILNTATATMLSSLAADQQTIGPWFNNSRNKTKVISANFLKFYFYLDLNFYDILRICKISV